MRRRRFDDVLNYRTPKGVISAYARLMRGWAGFETTDGTDGHLVRLTPRDFPIFRRLPHGSDYPQARKLAEELFAAAAQRKGLPASEAEPWQELRSTERRVGKACVRTFSSRWSPSH